MPSPRCARDRSCASIWRMWSTPRSRSLGACGHRDRGGLVAGVVTCRPAGRKRGRPVLGRCGVRRTPPAGTWACRRRSQERPNITRAPMMRISISPIAAAEPVPQPAEEQASEQPAQREPRETAHQPAAPARSPGLVEPARRRRGARRRHRTRRRGAHGRGIASGSAASARPAATGPSPGFGDHQDPAQHQDCQGDDRQGTLHCASPCSLPVQGLSRFETGASSRALRIA